MKLTKKMVEVLMKVIASLALKSQTLMRIQMIQKSLNQILRKSQMMMTVKIVKTMES